MAYKISRGRPKTIPESYYNEEEIRELRNRYHGKLPPFTEISRVGTRRILKVEKIIHKQGSVVNYKDKLAIVRKSTKRGLYLEIFKKDKDDISYPSGKIIFVPQKEVERKVYPNFFPQLSIGVISPYNMATVDD